MKTNLVKQNYAVPRTVTTSKPAGTKVNNHYSPSFSGSAPAPKFANYIKQKNFVSFLEKLKWFDGEQGRILITALGTGVIAPLFIAWNPYVKPKENATEEEKENLKKTQKYTAMRQPISAGLAIPIQLSLITPIEKGLDIIFNNPKYSKFLPTYLDKSALQDDKYIERQEKSKLKNENQSLSKEEFKRALEQNVETTKNQQIADVARGLVDSGQIRIREGAEGLVDDKSVIESLRNEIKNYASDTNFLRYDSLSDEDLIKLFNDPNADISEVTTGKESYVKRAETLINNKTALQDALVTNLPNDKSNLTEYFKKLADKTSDLDLKKVYQEFVDLADNKAQTSRAARTIERIQKIEEACGGSFDANKYLNKMKSDDNVLLGKLRRFAQISKNLEENPAGIKKAIEELAQNCQFDKNDKQLNTIFHDISTFGDDFAKLKGKISKDIVKGYKNMIKSRYRFIKELVGISLGLFVTVPVTCHALNWVYPRFMDKFFPNLSKTKKTPESNKQQNNNLAIEQIHTSKVFSEFSLNKKIGGDK